MGLTGATYPCTGVTKSGQMCRKRTATPGGRCGSEHIGSVYDQSLKRNRGAGITRAAGCVAAADPFSDHAPSGDSDRALEMTQMAADTMGRAVPSPDASRDSMLAARDTCMRAIGHLRSVPRSLVVREHANAIPTIDPRTDVDEAVRQAAWRVQIAKDLVGAADPDDDDWEKRVSAGIAHLQGAAAYFTEAARLSQTHTSGW